MRRTRVDDAWSARNFRACSRSDFWSGEKSKFMAGGSYGIARGGATALGLALGQRRRYPRALHDPDEVKDSCLARPRLDHVAEVGEMLPLPGRGTQAVARRRGEVESRRPHRDAREAVEVVPQRNDERVGVGPLGQVLDRDLDRLGHADILPRPGGALSFTPFGLRPRG